MIATSKLRINDPTLKAITQAAACLAVAAVVWLGIYAGWVLKWHPEFEPFAERAAAQQIDPLTLSGRDFQPLGLVPTEQMRDAQVITRYVDNQAMWVTTQFFEAADFALLRFNVAGIHPDMALQLAWRRLDMAPGSVHQVTLHTSGDGVGWYNLARHPEWRGTIAEVRIGAVGQSPTERFVLMRDEPLVLYDLTFQPFSVAGVINTIWAEWTHFEGWHHTSVNRFLGVPHDEALFRPNAVLTVWLFSGAVLLVLSHTWGRWRSAHPDRRRALWAPLAAMVVMVWLVQDGIRMPSRFQQGADTVALFANKTLPEKAAISRLRCDQMDLKGARDDCRQDEPLPHL